MSVQLLGKRELKRLASVANDGAGAGYSGFAKGMMAKMGWAEGQGLGKDMQGRSTYVQVKKKDDNAGLGKEKAQQNKVNDQWYFDAFDSAVANMGGKKKKKGDKKKKKADKKREKTGEDEEVEPKGGMSMYEKMFKATGGARMGMRARASQNGKLARTEGGKDGAGPAPPTAANGSIKSEGRALASHKRKRAGDTEGVAAEQLPDSADTVVVKQEKMSGEKRVAKTEGGGKAEEPEVRALVERKRERSKAKKAKRAGKSAQEEKAEAADGVQDENDAAEQAAPGKDKSKSRKKKKKRAAKEA